jgi:acyl-coenzyme A thioesterase PaaI-like protein
MSIASQSSQMRPLLEAARSSGNWQPLVDAVPYARWLGLLVEPRAGELVCHLKFEEMLVGNATIPALHGGALGGLLESAAAFQLLYAHESIVLPKIINVTVDYLRSARAVDTFATGIITKQGRRVTSVRALAWQEDRNKPVAAANAHFLVQDGVDDGS